jgi:hypothetical protein
VSWLDVQKMNFSHGVKMYTQKVTSNWYFFRCIQLPKEVMRGIVAVLGLVLRGGVICEAAAGRVASYCLKFHESSVALFVSVSYGRSR